MKSRRLSTVLMCCLIAVLCGLGGYIVFASVNVTLTATNNIIFNSLDQALYTATVKVYYEGETTPIVTDSINHNGNLSEQDLSKTNMKLGNGIQFSTDHRTIIYEITITNCKDKNLQIKLNKPEGKAGVYTNTIEPISIPEQVGVYDIAGSSDDVASIILNQVSEPNDKTKTTTLILKAHLISAEHSFLFDNTFSIDLSDAN